MPAETTLDAPGGTLRTLRLARGLSQRELARRARVGQRTIEHIEHGRRPRQATRKRLLVALGEPWDHERAVEVFGSAREVMPRCDRA